MNAVIYGTSVAEIANENRLKRAFSVQMKEKKPVFYVLPSHRWLKTARKRQPGLAATTFDDIAAYLLKQAGDEYVSLTSHERSLFFQQFMREVADFENEHRFIKAKSYADTYGQVKRLGLSVEELPPSLSSLASLFASYEKNVVLTKRLYDPENRLLRAIDFVRSSPNGLRVARVIIDGYFDFSPLQMLFIEALKRAEIPIELYVPNDTDYSIVKKTVAELKSIGFRDERQITRAKRRVIEKEVIAATTEEEQWRGVMEEIVLSGEPFDRFGILLVDETDGLKALERYSDEYGVPLNVTKKRPLKATSLHSFLLFLLKQNTPPKTRWEALSLFEHVLKLFFVNGLGYAKQKAVFLKTGEIIERSWAELYDKALELISSRSDRFIDALERVREWLFELPVVSFWEVLLEKETDIQLLKRVATEYRAWQELVTELDEYKTKLKEKGLETLTFSQDLFAEWFEEIGERLTLYTKRASQRGVHVFTWRDIGLFSGETLYVVGMNEGMFPRPLHLSGYVQESDVHVSPVRFSAPTQAQGRIKQRAYFQQLDYVAKTIRFVYVKGVDPNAPLLKSSFLADVPLRERTWSTNERMKKSFAFSEDDQLEKIAFHVGSEFEIAALPDRLRRLQTRQKRLRTGEEHLPSDRIERRRAVSITELESYARCPFRYGIERLIDAKTPMEEMTSVSPLAIGQIVHEIMKELYEEQGLVGIPFAQVPKETLERMSILLDEKFEQKWQEIERAHLDVPLYERLLTKRLWRKRLQKWWEAERKCFWDNEKLADMAIMALEKPLRVVLSLRGGEQLVLTGKADRVDISDSAFVVYDYKTGNVNFHEEEIRAGLKIQLPLYAFALQEQLKDRQADGATYISLHDPEKRAGNGIWREEHVGKRSKYDVKHQAKKDDTLGTEAFLTKYELNERIEQLWIGMHADFSVTPLDCSPYCPYETICRVTKEQKEA